MLVVFKISKSNNLLTDYENLDFKNYLFGLLLLILSIFIIQRIIWTLTGVVVIKISNEELIITKRILGIGSVKKYDLMEISEILISTNTKSNSYWNFNGLRINDNIEKTFHFKYLTRKESFGKDLTDFDAEAIKNEISTRQKKNNWR
jgi:hypothetical protein